MPSSEPKPSSTQVRELADKLIALRGEIRKARGVDKLPLEYEEPFTAESAVRLLTSLIEERELCEEPDGTVTMKTRAIKNAKSVPGLYLRMWGALNDSWDSIPYLMQLVADGLEANERVFVREYWRLTGPERAVPLVLNPLERVEQRAWLEECKAKGETLTHVRVFKKAKKRA